MVEEEEAEQFIEVEQLAIFSLTLIKEGFFDIGADSSNIHVVVPTKVQFKFMMRRKGKEHMEEGSSPTKMILKRTPIKAKEIQKMLEGSEWDPKSDNGQSEPIWVACLLFIGRFHD
jgi:hypothetical protein